MKKLFSNLVSSRKDNVHVQPKDFLLLAVSFGSLIAGILAPVACAPLQPYPWCS